MSSDLSKLQLPDVHLLQTAIMDRGGIPASGKGIGNMCPGSCMHAGVDVLCLWLAYTPYSILFYLMSAMSIFYLFFLHAVGPKICPKIILVQWEV